MSQGRGEIALAGAGGAGDQAVEVLGDPLTAGQLQHQGLVQPPRVLLKSMSSQTAVACGAMAAVSCWHCALSNQRSHRWLSVSGSRFAPGHWSYACRLSTQRGLCGQLALEIGHDGGQVVLGNGIGGSGHWRYLVTSSQW